MFDITCKDITKVFPGTSGSITPIKNLNIHFKAGDISALIGESGCGKTTFLRLLAGLERPDSGEILFHGEVSKKPVISVVFQEPRLFDWLSVRDNIELPIRYLPSHERKNHSDKVLELVRLERFASAYPKELSGGMAQRVGLARALINQPDILLLDEAFSALDAITRRKLYKEFIDIYTQEPITTVLVTHDIAEAVLLARHVYQLSQGHLQQHYNINYPYPRTLSTPGISEDIDSIYSTFTNQKETV